MKYHNKGCIRYRKNSSNTGCICHYFFRGKTNFSNKEKIGRPFLVCINCGKKKEMPVSYGAMISDKKAAEYFWKFGWTIFPTYCAIHSKRLNNH